MLQGDAMAVCALLAVTVLPYVKELAFHSQARLPVVATGTVGSGWRNGKVRLLDLDRGHKLQADEDSGAVMCLAFSQNGEYLATGDYDRGVFIWNVETGSRRDVWRLNYRSGAYSLTFSNDNKFLCCGRYDGTVQLWNTLTHKATAMFDSEEPPDSAPHVAFAHAGDLLLAGGQSGEVRCWDMRTRRERWKKNKPVVWMETVASGDVLGIAKEGARYRVFSLLSDRSVVCVPDSILGTTAMTISNDCKFLAQAENDGAVVIYSVPTGRTHCICQDSTKWFYELAFSPDGRLLAGAGTDGTVELWDVDSGGHMYTLSDQTGPVFCVAFSPDGKLLASGNRDGTCIVWDLAVCISGNTSKRTSIEELWKRLADGNCTNAWKAVLALANRKEAAHFIRKRLQDVAHPNEEVRRLIQSLDSDDFKLREASQRRLQAMHAEIRPLLLEAVAHAPSPEARARLEHVIRAQDSPTRKGEQFVTKRAIAVLERIGTEEASQTLRELARCYPNSLVGLYARDALARMQTSSIRSSRKSTR
jgi:WD40 repeat protein